jgi:membrane associated rhomboid family serine protease
VIPLKDDIPTRRFPVLTVAIILINVVVFFAFQDARLSFSGAAVNDQKVVDYGAIPYEFTHPGKECFAPQQGTPGTQVVCEGQEIEVKDSLGQFQTVKVPDDVPKSQTGDQPPAWLTLFSSMFMHGGILHIAGNMLFLWIFGNNIEDSMSRWRFALFYLLGGAVALAAQTAIDPSAATPTIGASGAVAGVLGAYALLYPRARVVTVVFIILFVTILELPALLVLGLWFLLQVFYGTAELGQPLGGSGGVAYFAHIGGFLFGLLLIRVFANKVHEDYLGSRRIPVY